MKVLVFGAGGQLGRELMVVAPPDIQIAAVDHSTADIGDSAKVDAIVSQSTPDTIINCAAYTNVDRAETEVDVARAVNSLGAAHIAEAARKAGNVRVIHVSTDYVFDGEASRPYRPGDTCSPLSVYGRTKLDGENHVLGLLPDKAVVFRTSWVYSRYGRNFVKTILRLINEKNEISVVSDQIGSPTWARSLALAIWRVLRVPEASGVMHWTDSGVASWFDFAVAIQEEAERIGIIRRRIPILPIASSEYPTAARRPSFSVLDSSESWRILGERPHHWRESLRVMLAGMDGQS